SSALGVRYEQAWPPHALRQARRRGHVVQRARMHELDAETDRGEHHRAGAHPEGRWLVEEEGCRTAPHGDEVDEEPREGPALPDQILDAGRRRSAENRTIAFEPRHE